MAKVWIDILVDEDGDQVFENGDYKIGNAIDQDTEMILSLSPGQWCPDPVIGPAIFRMMKSNKSGTEIRRSIKLSLARDKKRLKNAQVVDGVIKIDCEQL